MGFDLLKVISQTNALLIVPTKEICVGFKPVMQFDLMLDTEFPSLKMKVITILAHYFSTTKELIVRLVKVPLI